jgi:hypothetical protein
MKPFLLCVAIIAAVALAGPARSGGRTGRTI